MRRRQVPEQGGEAPAPDVVFAVADAWLSATVLIRRGEAWASDDAVVLAHPEHFDHDPRPYVRRSQPGEVVGA